MVKKYYDNVDIDVEKERLITAVDNRQSYFIKDLPEDVVAVLQKGPQGPSRPELDHLMRDRGMDKEDHQKRLASLLADVFNDTEAALLFMMRPHPQLDNETPGCAVVTESGCRAVEDIIRKGLHGLPV